MNSTHPFPTIGTSQCDLILEALQTAAPGEWVSVLHLHEISRSLAVHSRINDLRQRGHHIEHKNDYEGRAVLSFYRLINTGLQPGESAVSTVS